MVSISYIICYELRFDVNKFTFIYLSIIIIFAFSLIFFHFIVFHLHVFRSRNLILFEINFFFIFINFFLGMIKHLEKSPARKKIKSLKLSNGSGSRCYFSGINLIHKFVTDFPLKLKFRIWDEFNVLFFD